MEPKEKAKELVYEMSLATDEYGYINTNVHRHKQCALKAVDEIMKAPHENNYMELIPTDAESTDWFWNKFDEYWKEVKQEIEKL